MNSYARREPAGWLALFWHSEAPPAVPFSRARQVFLAGQKQATIAVVGRVAPIYYARIRNCSFRASDSYLKHGACEEMSLSLACSSVDDSFGRFPTTHASRFSKKAIVAPHMVPSKEKADLPILEVGSAGLREASGGHWLRF